MVISRTSKAKEFLKRNWTFLFVLTVVFFTFILPLIPIQVPTGHDIYFHMERIESLADSMTTGDWFPRIYHTAVGNQGYASPMFYGDLFLRIPALFVMAGMSVPVAYKIFIMIIALSTAIISYLCFDAMIKNKKIAAVGTILYAVSSYFATDLFARAAIGEAQVFAFIPIAFLGYYNILFEDRKKWYLLSLGLFFMVQCHLITAVAFVIILALLSLFYIPKFIKEPKSIVYVGLSALCFFIFSAYFLLPMLEQFKLDSFFANDGTAATKWGTLEQRTLPWWGVFSDFTYTKLVKSRFWMPNGVGLVIIPIWIFSLFSFIKTKGKKSYNLFVFLGFGTGLMFMTTEIFPWKYFQNIFGVMQFPWRLLVFAVFFLSLSAMWILKSLNKKQKVAFAIIAILLSSFSLVQSVVGKYDAMFEMANNNEIKDYRYNNNIGACEYFTTGMIANEVYKYKDRFLTNNPEADIIMERQMVKDKYNGVMQLEISGNYSDDMYIDIPLLSYYGYSAVTKTGDKLELTRGFNNRIRILVQDMQYGVITVEYTGTMIQHLSDIISLTAFLLFGVYLVYRLIFRSKKNVI